VFEVFSDSPEHSNIDTILAKHKNNESVYERQGTDIFKGLIKMMITGRIDMLLGYP
jgi:hypothetical protein